MKLKFENAEIITPTRLLKDAIVLTNGRSIEYVGANIHTEDYKTIDCGGGYLSPGFIDLHVHGGGGFDFMDGTPEAIIGAAKLHAKYGTTSLLCTGLASDNDELMQFFDAFEKARTVKDGANLLGIHLEGPYYAESQRGAQDKRYLRNPSPEHYNAILDRCPWLRMWSMAPELAVTLELGSILSSRGIIAAIGHSDATFDEVLAAIDHGFSHITHLYSCTSMVKRVNCQRVAGIVEAAFYSDNLTVEAIADGIHLPPSLLKLIYKLKGSSRMTLVTDSMRGSGMPNGESILGSTSHGQRVQIRDGIALLPDGSGFAGSVATAQRLVKNMVELAGVSITEAVAMMTLTPARILSLPLKGRIAAGADADIVILSRDLKVLSTVVMGDIL